MRLKLDNIDTKRKDPHKKESENSTVCIFGIILTVFVIAFRFLYPYSFYQVSGNSMYPTYHDGQILKAQKFYENKQELERYDIVIARSSIGTLIKRVVGLPGETIEIKKDGRVYANGVLLEKLDSYLCEEMESYNDTFFYLGENEYFVLGDNINNSADSRKIGLIKRENIIGMVSITSKDKKEK